MSSCIEQIEQGRKSYTETAKSIWSIYKIKHPLQTPHCYINNQHNSNRGNLLTTKRHQVEFSGESLRWISFNITAEIFFLGFWRLWLVFFPIFRHITAQEAITKTRNRHANDSKSKMICYNKENKLQSKVDVCDSTINMVMCE